MYQVPWKVVKPEEALPAGSLALYWFPSSVDEFKNSSLRNSRSQQAIGSTGSRTLLKLPNSVALSMG